MVAGPRRKLRARAHQSGTSDKCWNSPSQHVRPSPRGNFNFPLKPAIVVSQHPAPSFSPIQYQASPGNDCRTSRANGNGGQRPLSQPCRHLHPMTQEEITLLTPGVGQDSSRSEGGARPNDVLQFARGSTKAFVHCDPKEPRPPPTSATDDSHRRRRWEMTHVDAAVSPADLFQLPSLTRARPMG